MWWPVPAARALALSTELVGTLVCTQLSSCRRSAVKLEQLENGQRPSSSDPKRWENVAWPRNLPRRLPFFPAHQSKGILPGEITPDQPRYGPRLPGAVLPWAGSSSNQPTQNSSSYSPCRLSLILRPKKLPNCLLDQGFRLARPLQISERLLTDWKTRWRLKNPGRRWIFRNSAASHLSSNGQKMLDLVWRWKMFSLTYFMFFRLPFVTATVAFFKLISFVRNIVKKKFWSV